MGLDVGALGAEEFLDAVDGQVLVTTVVALGGIALGVLVGQLCALGPHDRRRGVVFAGDQFDVLLLPGVFSLDGGKELRAGLLDEKMAVVHDRLMNWGPLQQGSPGERRNANGNHPLAARSPVVRCTSGKALAGPTSAAAPLLICGGSAYRRVAHPASVAPRDGADAFASRHGPVRHAARDAADGGHRQAMATIGR